MPRRDAIRVLIDALNEMLAEIAAELPEIFYVDLKQVLQDPDWANELHPTRAGFLKVTTEIEAALRVAVP